MSFNYSAFIIGGEGPDVWDKEVEIYACDFADAASQAVGKAEQMHGHLVRVEQEDAPSDSYQKLSKLRADMERLAARWEPEMSSISDSGSITREKAINSLRQVELLYVLSGQTPPDPGMKWPV